MHEYRRMIEAVDGAADLICLATVVDVDGSAYRRPGARLLIRPGAGSIGSISGGCLERDLCRAAPELTRDGPRVVSFDTRMDGEDANPRYNLGCSGVIHVLVERVTGDVRCPLAIIRRALATDRPQLVATVYASDGGAFPPVGARIDDFETGAQAAALAEHAAAVRTSGRPLGCELVDGEQSCRLLLERIDPPRRLFVFGAGDDARPLCVMAGELGWQVTIVDKRREMLTAARFPSAERLCADPGDVPRRLAPDARAAAVLMTHSFADDAVLLPWLLAGNAGYIGLLGPKTRTAKLMLRLHEAGTLPSPEALDRLHSPVGLDLGASTPATVALSILAEIVAEDNDRSGRALQARQGPIHAPAAHVLVDVARARVGAGS